MNQPIPIDRVMAQLGRTHLELSVTQDTVQQQQQAIIGLTKQLEDAKKQLAEANEKLKKYEDGQSEPANRPETPTQINREKRTQ